MRLNLQEDITFDWSSLISANEIRNLKFAKTHHRNGERTTLEILLLQLTFFSFAKGNTFFVGIYFCG